MSGEPNIFLRFSQRAKAFLTSRDALTFCFFVLFAGFIWFVHKYEADPAEQIEHPETSSPRPIEYAEKTLNVPIKTENVPEGKHLTLFEGEVTVRIKLPKEQYDKIGINDFQATCSFPKEASETLPVNVQTNQTTVQILSYTPAEVQYLIN